MKHSLLTVAALPIIMLVTISILSCTSDIPPLIPTKAFFGNPEKSHPSLSPDGTMLSYHAPLNDVMNIWIRSVDADDDRPITRDTLRGIYYHSWAEDNRHILYDQDKDGDENWRLYAVNIETSEVRDMTPFDGVSSRVIATDKKHPDDILVGMNRNNPQAKDVYNLNLISGDLKLVERNPGKIRQWITDADFRIRAATQINDQSGMDLLVRKSEDADWIKLLSWTSEELPNSNPICFTKDGKSVYIRDSRDSNAGRLILVDIASGEMKTIAEDSQFEIDDVIVNPDSYEIEGVVFEKDRYEITVLDNSIKDDIEVLRGVNRGEFFIYDRDNADENWLIRFSSDINPASYYLYNRISRKARFLFDEQPDLNKYSLAPMETFTFIARDGLTIHGYITFPPGKGHSDLPTVLRVHGGPMMRDYWGYDEEVQWLANRGYVCLQVNYRGSTGFGRDFTAAGYREWGGTMQDDLTDAVNWAMERGYVDPERIAIYGTSYGGYAALVGATLTPDLYACAIDVSGFSNILTLLESLPPYWKNALDIVYSRIGNPDTDRALLRSRSPLFYVDSIKIPILIVQGANDPRVPQREAEQIVEAMKARGIDYEYMFFPDEGHSLTIPENRFKFYSAAEEFLAKHLGGRSEREALPSDK